jgi:hypothetical protein
MESAMECEMNIDCVLGAFKRNPAAKAISKEMHASWVKEGREIE